MNGTLKASTATISPCGKYRYWLERHWGKGYPMVLAMLNPSTADASVNDPTIRRCVGFAKREGASGLIVVNLFGLRATDPHELSQAADPVGTDNAHHIGNALVIAAANRLPIVCAWGAYPLAEEQMEAFCLRATVVGTELVCFGKTKSGAPKHPLYLPANTPLIPYA